MAYTWIWERKKWKKSTARSSKNQVLYNRVYNNVVKHEDIVRLSKSGRCCEVGPKFCKNLSLLWGFRLVMGCCMEVIINTGLIAQRKPLNGIPLGERQTDYNNQLIISE